MAAAMLAAGCAGGGDVGAASGTSARPVVVTDIYPTTFAVQQVAGDAVDVVQLAPTGVEPHDYELTPQQVQQIVDADLVAYLPGMVPAVQDALAQASADRSVDLASAVPPVDPATDGSGEEPRDRDPHVWLDPANMAVMGGTATDALARIGVAADASGLKAQMESLDREIGSALSDCEITTMVVSHEAFGYLAHAYGFTQVGISGLSPQAEPSAARMARISDLVKSEGITTVYFESLVSPDAANAIAAETGATTALLDPIENNTDDQGYPAIMRSNSAALRTGQSCT